MSFVKPKVSNLNDFLTSKKFNKREKRSLSRTNSDFEGDNSLHRDSESRRNPNVEQISPRKPKLNYDDEGEDYYESRESRLPLKKTRSIQSPQEVFSQRLKRRDLPQEEEEEYEEPQTHNRGQNSNSSETFQSSRKEAKHFVEVLARKINIEIGNINNTIEEFNRSLKRTIDVEYAKLRTAIKNAVEEVFENEEDNIRKLAKMEQKSVNQQLSEVRADLENMYGRLQKYKQGLDGPNWKKMTGQLLASDIEQNVYELLKKSERMKVLRNIKIQLDQKKEHAFATALQNLLEVNLIGGLEMNQLGIAVN